jgi:hypothetical protein
LRTRRSIALALLSLAALPACVSSRTTNVERIGGRLRERPFASPTAYEAYLRGELAAARGDLLEADRQLGLAAFADAADPWIVARRVHHLLAAGQHARAIEVARAATERHPASSAAWLSLAAALGETPSTLVERDAALARAVGLDPEDPEVRASAVRIASRQSVTDAAPAPPRSPPGAGVPVERLAEAGAWSRAAAMLDLAQRRRPGVGDRLGATVAHLCAGDPSRARAALDALSRRRGPVDRAALAWLWLRAGERGRAREESALAMAEGVAGAAAVRAQALAASDEATQALRVAGLVDAAERAPDVAPVALAAWAGRCARSGLMGRAEGSAPGSSLGMVTVALAGALDRAGHPGLGDVAIARALQRLRALGVDRAAARDALRAAAAARLDRLGREPDAALDEVETAEGALARAAGAAWRRPTARTQDDLTTAAGDPALAVWSAAWRVLVCARTPAGCTGADVEAAAGVVRASVDEAPVVLRAQALLARDPSGLDRAADADPRSPWDPWVRAQISPADRSP